MNWMNEERRGYKEVYIASSESLQLQLIWIILTNLDPLTSAM